MITKFPIIGVMGSHEQAWEEFSIPLGRMIAQHDYHLLTGAGAGAMTAVSKAFTEEKDREGLSIGIIPTVDYDGAFVSKDKYPNPYIEIPIITPLDVKAQNDTTPYSKNYVNIMTSHALVVLPGDHGTRNEVSIAIKYKKPMILFGSEKSFEKFPEYPTRVQDIEDVRLFLEKATAQFRTDG